MKGIVFTLFSRFVEQDYGMMTWDQMLDKVKLSCDGVFTAGDTYNHEELVALLVELSKETNVPVPLLLKQFGKNMLWQLSERYPVFFQPGMTAKQFIRGIEDTIHLEVLKLYPDADLPRFSYEDKAEDELVMVYNSPRKLCALAEGLIDGAGEYFKTDIRYLHTECLLNGDAHCRLELSFN